MGLSRIRTPKLLDRTGRFGNKLPTVVQMELRRKRQQTVRPYHSSPALRLHRLHCKRRKFAESDGFDVRRRFDCGRQSGHASPDHS